MSANLVATHLAEARAHLADARQTLAGDWLPFVGPRAFRVMFAAAQALLVADGVALPIEWPAVIVEFGRRYVETERAPATLHCYLLDGVKAQTMDTLGPYRLVSATEAAAHLARAEAFLLFAERRLDPRQPSGEVNLP